MVRKQGIASSWWRLALVALVVVFGVGSTGCDKIADKFKKKAAAAAAKELSGDTGSASGINYFADASTLPTIYKAKIGGPTRVLEMLIYPTYGYAQIQDPKKLENVDQYDMRNGKVQDGAPVKFVGHTPTVADLKEITFDIGEVDFAAVPKMAKDAPAQLKIDDGKVTHMILQRPLPFNKEVRFRVYVNGSRKDGSVEYDAKGNMKKVYN